MMRTKPYDSAEEDFDGCYDDIGNDDANAQDITSGRVNDLLDHEYDAEDLTYLGTLKESEVAERLREHICSSPLLAGSQRALLQIVDTYISRDFILANIENPAYALNSLDIAFSLAVLSATTYDTKHPDWLMTQSHIRSTFEVLLTRAHGSRRERILQDMRRVEVMTEHSTNLQNDANIAKKRNLGLPWRR